jgi:hypothetical protein
MKYGAAIAFFQHPLVVAQLRIRRQIVWLAI